MRNALLKVGAPVSMGMLLAMSGVAASQASAAPVPFLASVFVSTTGSPAASGHSCGSAAFTSIQAAVEAAPVRATVVVCPGTYLQNVTVDKSITLSGRPGAIINATGDAYGVGVTASWVTVTGLTVEGANASVNSPMGPTTTLADGIVTAGGYASGPPLTADHVTITHNIVEGNAGSGIDLNSTSYSVATGNFVTNNGVGINISDDFGVATSHNVISKNVSNDNPGGCGIDLADHTGVGVFDNLVTDNISNDNGLGSPTGTDASSGSGVILADPTPVGGVYNNLISGNQFNGNGHPGFVLVTGGAGDMNGNVVIGNEIGSNNSHTDAADPNTTGVYVADLSPVTIQVARNFIHDDYYGVFTIGAASVTGVNTNVFHNVTSITGYSAAF